MFTDCIQGHARVRFNDHFIMNVHDNGTVAECLHGITENITGRCLHNVFDKFRAIGIETLPLLGATDTFIGGALTIELIRSNLRFHIREIRLSERRFYQKITDIYATALDYDRTAKTTKQFFAKVQNKMHYAVHGHTAAELIYERADADKPHMGLTTWATAPEGKIVKSDVSVAKNYLSEQEMRSLERIVSAYLDLAEDRAERHIPMTMEDWAKRLDLFLMADDREVLQDAGKITAEIAKAKAETEFEKYRVIQDRLFMSDFDKYMLELEENAKK